jgi:hypothetical protein
LKHPRDIVNHDRAVDESHAAVYGLSRNAAVILKKLTGVGDAVCGELLGLAVKVGGWGVKSGGD